MRGNCEQARGEPRGGDRQQPVGRAGADAGLGQRQAAPAGRPGCRRGGAPDRAVSPPACWRRQRRRQLRQIGRFGRVEAGRQHQHHGGVGGRGQRASAPRVCAGSNGSQPGVSISTGALCCRRVSARPRVTGWLATIRLMPSSRVKAASCSVAPARLPSAVITIGRDAGHHQAGRQPGDGQCLAGAGGPTSSSGGSPAPSGSVRERQRARPARSSRSPCCRAACSGRGHAVEVERGERVRGRAAPVAAAAAAPRPVPAPR